MAKSIEQARAELAAGAYELSRHAYLRALQNNIPALEIAEAGERAIIIEDYPDDKYSPSCLLLGFTRAGRPLHMQVSLADTDLVKIVTLYEPDGGEWVDYSVRR